MSRPRPQARWAKGAAGTGIRHMTPPPPSTWSILNDGVEVATELSDWDALAVCQHLHETAPTARLELRRGQRGTTRPWHPEYPSGRSLGLWEDLIRQYEPFAKTLEFVRDATGKDAILAGGCIRDFMVFERPDKIKDFDCFLLDTAEGEDAPLAHKLRTAVEHVGGVWRQALWIREYHDIARFNRFCVEIEVPWAPAGKPVQIITSLGKTPEEVVDHFDWTACMFWYDGRSVGATGMSDFGTGGLSLNHPQDKELKRVLKRGLYLEEKFAGSAYPLKLTEATILHLASLMFLDPPLRDGRIDTLSEFP